MSMFCVHVFCLIGYMFILYYKMNMFLFFVLKCFVYLRHVQKVIKNEHIL